MSGSRTDLPSAAGGVLNFCCPGTFEQAMPAIADWFAKNPPGSTE